MRTDRILIRAKPYGVKDPRRLRKHAEDVAAAGRIQAHIVRQWTERGERVFLYHEIAGDLGLSKEAVASILAGCGGGNSGITLRDPPPTP